MADFGPLDWPFTSEAVINVCYLHLITTNESAHLCFFMSRGTLEWSFLAPTIFNFREAEILRESTVLSQPYEIFGCELYTQKF